ncbi:Ribose ABC transport system, permease protein RbsC [Rubellimicrobium mesophilum DSM 19309]|uniref:Ribose ABC transport system, permease protein RbsC n=1 Tax=Rubellimicrobium mesophilum DSM 19309 TaxID=442562 RepID=A0A017HN64_9RHOB|nr:ABC transporter permease [Rubellimicrobium mesophilum]EYD75563.1 Ribose ABC transport system, permease protein RbsC [Rubellimicrobium mesophilum DSM 19309]
MTTSASTEGLDSRQSRGLGRLLLDRPELMILVALLIMIVVFATMRPDAFLSAINIRNMAMEAGMMMFLATGMTYVIVTAGIDLSVGAVLVFSGVCSVLVMRLIGVDSPLAPWIGLVVAVLAGVAWGALNGVLIARANLSPLIVTLATMGIALGASRLLVGGVDITGVPSSLVNTIGVGRIWGIPVIFLLSLAFAGLMGIVLHRTRFGLHTFAVGSNPQGAERAGIDVARHLTRIYMISGLCAGIAGYLTLSRFASTTIAGHAMDNLKAITAVVLGGASLFGGSGTLVGTGIGVLIPVVLASGLVIVGLPSFWQEVAVGIVLLAAVMIDQWRRTRRSR